MLSNVSGKACKAYKVNTGFLNFSDGRVIFFIYVQITRGFIPVNPGTHRIYKDLRHPQTVPRHPRSPSVTLPSSQTLRLTWVVRTNLYNSTQMCTSSLTARGVNVGLPCSGGGWDSDDPQDTPVRPNAPVSHTDPLPMTTEIVSPPSRLTTVTTTATTNRMSVERSTNRALVSTLRQPL